MNSQPQINVEQDRNTQTLSAIRGTIVNPFEFPIENCVLYFDDWAYVFDQPLQPGESIDIQTETEERTIRGLLTRKVGVGDGDSTITPWNTTSQDLNRISQMMALFDVAGGETYTTLTHRYHRFVDFSHQLKLNRAVLIGQVPKALTELQVVDARADSQADTSVKYRYDKQLSLIRISIPVNLVD